MPAPTASEVARLQADFGMWRTEVCHIQRPGGRERTSDGGYVDTYVTAETVACRRTPDIIPPVEREAAGRVQASMRWWISFPAGTAVRTTDRLVIGGRNYQVMATQDRSIEIERRVLALELT